VEALDTSENARILRDFLLELSAPKSPLTEEDAEPAA